MRELIVPAFYNYGKNIWEKPWFSRGTAHYEKISISIFSVAFC